MNTTLETSRQKISGDPMTSIVEMAEGNIGAIRVLTDLCQPDLMMGFMTILGLDDMNIRGPQIWIAFKDYCGQDIEKLRAVIKARDPAMVAMINERSGIKEQAVTSGASSP